MIPSLSSRNLMILVAAWCFLAGTRMPACQICLPIPQESGVDLLLDADAVVLARENPDKPFSLIAIEVLKGDLEEPAIDLFLDSTTRRLLSRIPERAVVCVRGASEDEKGWRRIGITNEIFEPVVREILSREAEWKEDPILRPKFFSKWLGHYDPQVRTIAHLEVARAPYDQIRELGDALSREQIHTFLGNFRYVEWHALYILLLGQSDVEEDHLAIAEIVQSAERFQSHLQLSAWLTAWIEVAPTAAIEFVETHYLSPDRTEEEMRAVQLALSVHGTRGRVELRDRIIEAYRSILANQPFLAPEIVTDTTNWESNELAAEVATVLRDQGADLDGTNRQMLRSYVQTSVAAKSSSPSAETESGRRDLLWLLLLLVLLPVALALRPRKPREKES